MQEQNLPKRNMVLLILSFSLLSLIFGFFYYYYRDKNLRMITVTGTAQAQVSNQISSYNLNLDIVNKDKAQAVDNATKRTNEIVKALKDFGIPEKDIQTQNLNIYQNQDPYYENGTTVYKPGNWHASYSITIVLRDLSKSDAFTSLLVGFENTTLFGPNLTIDQNNVDQATILSKAIEDARAKAQKLAASTGNRLGETMYINEGYTDNPIMPLYARGMGGGGGAALPVEAGSTTVSKTVTVTFRLK